MSATIKERPILFSAPMVCALLDGRKTQTRRIVKLEPFHMAAASVVPAPGADAGVFDGLNADGSICFHSLLCPYGKPGDRLWVKETINRGVDENGGPIERVSSFYAADGARTKADAWPWQRSVLPSIHCPRGLSRITLEVTGVRVERLNDISEADAIAEGLLRDSENGQTMYAGFEGDNWGAPVPAYRSLWESINGAGSWDANPWVWVVEFRRVSP